MKGELLKGFRQVPDTKSVNQHGVSWMTIVALGVILSVYHVLLRPWHRTWGATTDEVNRRLPGDDLVPEPSNETTRAVTVGASSDDVWSWIVQLGQGR